MKNLCYGTTRLWNKSYTFGDKTEHHSFHIIKNMKKMQGSTELLEDRSSEIECFSLDQSDMHESSLSSAASSPGTGRSSPDVNGSQSGIMKTSVMSSRANAFSIEALIAPDNKTCSKHARSSPADVTDDDDDKDRHQISHFGKYRGACTPYNCVKKGDSIARVMYCNVCLLRLVHNHVYPLNKIYFM